MSPKFDPSVSQAYLVGGGIASLAAAAYLIRDGRLPGHAITVFEESDQVGGSLDAHGNPEHGYVMRGGRMFDEEAYTCTFDLLAFIPSMSDPAKTVRQEFLDFNETFRSHSRSRLVANGRPVDVSSHGFSNRDRLDLIELMIHTEDSLGTRRIDECFRPAFFDTNFWYMWCTTFAFQPWHSAAEFRRYMLRFIQEFPRIETLAGVRRTPFNQYDSIVRPLAKWLNAQGVRFEMNCRVTDLGFRQHGDKTRLDRISCTRSGNLGGHAVEVDERDRVFATLGSMTAGSTLGTMDSPAPDASTSADGSWALWKTIAQDRPEFGRPAVFADHVEQSRWMSFTATLHDPLFFRLMQAFTGNEAGTGGLVTFKDSNWLMSVVLPRQPHFLDQPADVMVCWGYGLFPDKPGNYVHKKMMECTGAEILAELCAHLQFDGHARHILERSVCIPCMMPYITSQFMLRSKGDRPAVVPHGSTNFAFIGQFCEMPEDVVFTVEYSVRSAQTAVYSLLGLDMKVSPIYKGHHDVSVLFQSIKAMIK